MSRGGWFGKAGNWVIPIAEWVGVGGAWKVVRSNWTAGIDLLWHPGFLDLAANTGGGAPDFNEASQQVVFPYQGSIRLYGSQFTGTLYGNNTTWDLYLVNTNLQDQMLNFNALLRTNSTAWTAVGPINFLEITSAANDAVLTSITGAGKLDCLSIYGWVALTPLSYCASVLAQVTSLPAAGEVAWLWWGGTVAAGYAGVYIDETGKVGLHIQSSSGGTPTSKWTVSLAQYTYTAAATIGVQVKVYPAAPSTNEIWINGTSRTVTQPAVDTNWPDLNQNNPFMVGRGPNSAGTLTNTVGRYAKFRLSRDLTDDGAQYSIIGVAAAVKFNDGTTVTDARVLLRISQSVMDIVVPNVTVGPYTVTIENATGASRTFPFNVVNQNLEDSFDQTFVTQEDKTAAANRFMCPEYSWGTAGGSGNGGVIALNVAMQNNRLVLRGQGDLCTVGNAGVGRFGVPVARKTRVGAGVLTKKYCGPGTFEAWVTYPTVVGASPVFYLFFYQEVYPGDPRYAGLLAAGYTESGSSSDGYYIVVNEEIDMEVPYNASFDNMNFASWLDENTQFELNTTSLATFGITLTNGLEHHLKFRWYTAGDVGGARIVFYVDDQLIRTNTLYVPSRPGRIRFDYWFPSAAVEWAGSPAFDKQDVIISRLKYTKDAAQTMDLTAKETYPNTTYRRLITDNILPPL